MLALLLLACSRPGGPPTVNGDPGADWPALPGLDDEIVDIMDRHRVAGLGACIVKGGAVVWCGGYGDANPETGLKATARTPFLLASASKAVTGVAVLQAMEDGALSLDAPVSDHLDFAVQHPSDSQPITTRQLVTHTAGIADNWDAMEAHYVNGDASLSLRDFLAGYLARGGDDYDADDNFLADGVGEVYEYSNIGAALAGHMVEASTGTPFDDFCDARIFAPLGMAAGWHLADFDPDDVAAPVEIKRGRWDVLEHYGFPDYPDGQLRADAYSMGRFVAAISGGGAIDGVRVLSQDTVSALETPQVSGLDPDQGLMWYRWSLDGDTVVGHNGGEVGASTEILYRLGDGVGAVVLMNSAGRGGTLEDVELSLLDAASGL